MLESWVAFKSGGIMMLPLSALAVLALAIMLEKIWVYLTQVKLSRQAAHLLESYEFDMVTFQQSLLQMPEQSLFRRFFSTIVDNASRPVWWLESRAADEAQMIEHALSRRLWLLETTVTAAPLLGLMGTIGGMMHAFNLIGANGLVNPSGVTGGVAQALIATATGLLIALVSLFGFNYFSRLQAQTLDDMERLGTRLIDRIRLSKGQSHEAA